MTRSILPLVLIVLLSGGFERQPGIVETQAYKDWKAHFEARNINWHTLPAEVIFGKEWVTRKLVPNPRLQQIRNKVAGSFPTRLADSWAATDRYRHDAAAHPGDAYRTFAWAEAVLLQNKMLAKQGQFSIWTQGRFTDRALLDWALAENDLPGQYEYALARFRVAQAMYDRPHLDTVAARLLAGAGDDLDARLAVATYYARRDPHLDKAESIANDLLSKAPDDLRYRATLASIAVSRCKLEPTERHLAEYRQRLRDYERLAPPDSPVLAEFWRLERVATEVTQSKSR